MLNLLIDLDGTVTHGYHFDPKIRTCWDQNIERDLGINRKTFEQDFIFGSFSEFVLTGKLGLYDALATFLAGINYDGHVESVIQYWMEHDLDYNFQSIHTLQKLKASGKFKLILATNQEHVRANYIMHKSRLGELFDDIYHSARIGHKKPDPEYFQKVTSLLGNPKVPPIFFDDTPKYVEAANKAGWQAYQFTTAKDFLNCSEILEALE